MAATNTDKFKKGARRFTTTVGAGGISDASVTTVPLSSVTGLPTDTAVEIVVDRVDASGNLTLSAEEVITGVVSGSNLITCIRGVEGTAQAHSAGAVVEVRLTANQWDDMVDGLIVEHDQDGTHDTWLATLLATLLGSIYPVGSIYISGSSTMPTLVDDLGTWTRLEGVVIVGASDTDTDFDNGDTGGAKTHTLTDAQMPSHNHGGGSHRHQLKLDTSNSDRSANSNVDPVRSSGTGSWSGASHYTEYSGTTISTNGSDQAHNNLQPYKAKYMWERTA